jgi:hypothetical protein
MLHITTNITTHASCIAKQLLQNHNLYLFLLISTAGQIRQASAHDELEVASPDNILPQSETALNISKPPAIVTGHFPHFCAQSRIALFHYQPTSLLQQISYLAHRYLYQTIVKVKEALSKTEMMSSKNSLWAVLLLAPTMWIQQQPAATEKLNGKRKDRTTHHLILARRRNGRLMARIVNDASSFRMELW